jgi:hypothetical protein
MCLTKSDINKLPCRQRLFSIAQNLELIDITQEFSEKTGMTVAHETHLGRVGYSPQMINEIFAARIFFYNCRLHPLGLCN